MSLSCRRVININMHYFPCKYVIFSFFNFFHSLQVSSVLVLDWTKNQYINCAQYLCAGKSSRVTDSGQLLFPVLDYVGQNNGCPHQTTDAFLNKIYHKRKIIKHIKGKLHVLLFSVVLNHSIKETAYGHRNWSVNDTSCSGLPLRSH